MAGVHKKVFENVFSGIHAQFAEFHAEVALKPASKTNSLKRVFSVMYLAHLAET